MTRPNQEDTLTKAKTAPPRTDGAYLNSRTLSALTRGRDRRLTLVCAPAGFGKTTAVAAFYETARPRPIWYRLDLLDRDPLHFVCSLRTALYQSKWPAQDASCRQYRDTPLSLDRALLALAKETSTYLSDSSHIVLDDYHEIADCSEVNHVIDWLIVNMAEHMHFIVISRYPPSFPTARLQLADQVSLLGTDSLRFDENQTASLLAARSGIRFPEIQIAQLVDITEGWPAAIVLASQSIAVHDAESLAKMIINTRITIDIYTYFAEQVYNNQTTEIQHFLDQTCCLPYIDCATSSIMTDQHAAKNIARLVASNSFLFGTSDDDRFRYHALFSDFLRHNYVSKFGRHSLKELQMSSARALSSVGDNQMAIELMISANEALAALDLLGLCGEEGLDDFSTDSMLSWYSRLTFVTKEDHPWAQLLRAAICVRQGDLVSSLEAASKAAGLFASVNDSAGSYCALSVMEHVYFWQGRHRDCVSTCESAMAFAASDSQRYHTLLSMASAAIDSRDWATADASFEASLQCAKDAPLQERIRSRALLALEAYTRGDFRKADAIGCDIHAQLLSPMLSAGVSNVLGLVAAGLGEYDRALGILNASLEVADEYGLVLLSGMIRDNLAFLVSSMGDHVRALSMCRQNLECEEVLDSDPTLSAYRYNTYATILRRSGNLIDACASYAKARQCRRDTTDSLIALDIDANLLFADGLLGRSDLHGFDRIADEANANGLVYTSLQAKLYGFILKHSYDSNVSAVALRETVVAQIDHGHCDLLLHEVGSRPQFAVFVLNLLDDTHYASMLLDLFAKNGLFSNIFSEMATNSSPLLHLALLSASTHSNDHILSEVLQLSTGARNSIRLTAAIEQASDLLSMRVHNAISTNTHLHSLTSREMQVLALMASGLRNQEIASQLFISNATVKTHINHIFAKLQVSSRIEAVLRYTDSSRGLASRGQASPPSRA